MADISKIKLPSGTEYDIKDATARTLISNLSSATTFMGITITELKDGSTDNPILIQNNSNSPTVNTDVRTGAIAIYNKEEFIFDGSKWHSFGDLSTLGSLAKKNSASGSVKATGTVSKPTFTGTAVSYTPEGTVSVDAITPAGSVSQPTFTGTQQTASGITSSVTVSPAASGTATYTPAGSVSAPTITPNKSTTTVNSITGVGTLPSCTLPTMTTSVSNETLTIGWSAGSFSAGTLPTKGANTTVMTNVTATASAPTFTGTGVRLVSAAGTSSTTFTPSGTVSKPTFTGTQTTPSATFTGTAKNVTAAGTVSQPTFTGSAVTVTVS